MKQKKERVYGIIVYLQLVYVENSVEEEGFGWRREACKVEIKNGDRVEHEQSTLHMFSIGTRSSSTGDAGAGIGQVVEHKRATTKTWLRGSNKGYRMLQKIGWKEGEGLGRDKQGILEPIATEFRRTRAGIGRQKRTSCKRITHFPPEPTNTLATGIGDDSKEQKKALERKRRKKEQRFRRELYSDLPDEYDALF